jgi:hypothetical protein
LPAQAVGERFGQQVAQTTGLILARSQRSGQFEGKSVAAPDVVHGLQDAFGRHLLGHALEGLVDYWPCRKLFAPGLQNDRLGSEHLLFRKGLGVHAPDQLKGVLRRNPGAHHLPRAVLDRGGQGGQALRYRIGQGGGCLHEENDGQKYECRPRICSEIHDSLGLFHALMANRCSCTLRNRLSLSSGNPEDKFCRPPGKSI